MALYEIRALRFNYGDRFRLAIDDFRLDRGEKLAVIGRNGSGKTTLLRILALLERPASWECFRYRGRDAMPGRTSRAGIGLLRQQPWIFRGSVAANLAYSLRVRHVPRREIQRRAVEMGERLGLSALAKAPARSLSGGEQKRLALGRVLVAEPEVLLLDEPMAHLDQHSQEIIEEVLAASKTTLLIVTHDLRLASRFPGRTLVLKDGKISRGQPENILTGKFDGETLTTRRGFRIHTAHAPARSIATVTINPRAVVISLEPLRSSMRNVFPGRIEVIEMRGENVWLEIDCGETFVAFISRKSYEDLGLSLRRPVLVSFKAASVQVL
ncbi:MAG: ABC transporter ATP-binding protein [Candidatus Eisenbacteria bacterium]